MKHTLYIILALLCMALPSKAQKGLHVNEIFEGDIVEKTYMVDNLIKGEQLKPYKLTFFRSLKFKASAEGRAKIEKLVSEDIKNSLDLELERQRGKESDKNATPLSPPFSYVMMTLPPDGKFDPNSPNRWYLCYQCTPYKKNEYAITLVFMKGHATVKELRKMFKKN